MLHRIEELNPDQLAARLEARPILVMSFGTIEWHSHHLPLGLDGIVAQWLAEGIAEKADAVLFPTSYWAAGGVPYPYTLQLSGDIIEPLIEASFQQFAAMGFKVIIAITGHFGLEQTLALKRAAHTVMQRSSANILPLTEYDLTLDEGYKGDHAGIGETSLMLAHAAHLVNLEVVSADTALDGVLGDDPRGQASAAYGQRLFDLIVERASEFGQRFLDAMSPVERMDYIAALSAGLGVLQKTAAARQQQVKSQVPSIMTPAYQDYCQAIYAGDFREAKRHAERKLRDLTR